MLTMNLSPQSEVAKIKRQNLNYLVSICGLEISIRSQKKILFNLNTGQFWPVSLLINNFIIVKEPL